jgi:3-methylcrotonyl-CoA carboxylase alpha subunit
MIRKLLIANRGEIAARIVATARRMGIATVAVHSDADAGALHTLMADEAIRIGPASAAQSYLDPARLLAAARTTGADAIHPGYGFLSENPDFVEAVAAAGLTFVGPSATAIRAMGLKDAAKRLMEAAGVPVVPGYHGEDQRPEALAAEADRIGYPVMIKARAGGGGKGMRLVEGPADFAAALASAGREAEAAFGDPACLVEKAILRPRHIEIQVFGDSHGNAIHLLERDCSLQRRHQKVIEEAPAPGMTPEMRAAMGQAAVQAAQAIGYSGAGTVEFIVDASEGLWPDRFWFMEMNTRLQVEHPVTEAVTGLDLVEWQLRIAAGEALPLTQGDIAPNGHAIEARLYAEDPVTGFLPATGTLTHLAFPSHAAFGPGPLRVDAGVREGDTITPHYDPMIAKLIVHAPDRDAALAGLHAALTRTRIAGTTTNLAFLAALTQVPEVRAGDLDTGLIGRRIDDLTATPAPSDTALATAVFEAMDLLSPHPGDPWTALTGFRPWGRATQSVTLLHGDDRLTADVTLGPPHEVRLGGRLLDHGRPCASDAHDGRITVWEGGHAHVFLRPDPLDRSTDPAAAGDTIRAPMPGRVISVVAQAGQAVRTGDPLLTLEAMKMEHTLRALRDGIVAEVLTTEGAQVTQGATLIRLEPEA